MKTKTKTNTINNQKGFTLVEIIAVLVILGILAAVAVPKFINLQEDARLKAAQSAISETKARLSGAYGKFLLINNGVEPTSVSDICGEKGLNDSDILPTNGIGDVPMGDDFKVTLKSGTSTTQRKSDASSDSATITVTEVQEVKLETEVTDTWELP